jgi:4,5-dihydroxyphthalate decarboxylase
MVLHLIHNQWEGGVFPGFLQKLGREIADADVAHMPFVLQLAHGAKGFVQGHPKIARLFPDSRATEQDFFARTGVFPIMHAVAARRELVDRDPSLVAAVFAAYSESKRRAYAHMAGVAGLMDTLPWYGQELAATKALMGENFYSYGIEANRKSLETLFRYSHEQGFCSRRLTIEEIFEPSSLSLVEQGS